LNDVGKNALNKKKSRPNILSSLSPADNRNYVQVGAVVEKLHEA